MRIILGSLCKPSELHCWCMKIAVVLTNDLMYICCRLVVAILDSFHFDLQNSQEMSKLSLASQEGEFYPGSVQFISRYLATLNSFKVH